MKNSRSVVIKARVSEVGNERIVIHPNDDPNQSMTIPMADIIAFGGEKPKDEEKDNAA